METFHRLFWYSLIIIDLVLCFEIYYTHKTTNVRVYYTNVRVYTVFSQFTVTTRVYTLLICREVNKNTSVIREQNVQGTSNK